MTTRVITLYATKGAKKAKLETNVSTWGELKSLISKEGYDLKVLHATENINKTDLVNEIAVLPVGDFTVFLRPKQVKSGGRGDSMSYKDIKSAIKSDMEVNEDFAKSHYNEGKNYTTKGTEELRSLVNSYVAPSGQHVKGETVAETATATESSSTSVKTITNLDRVTQIETLLSEISINASSADVSDRADEITDDYLPSLKESIEDDTNATVTVVNVNNGSVTFNVADVVTSVADSKESAEDEGRRVAREKAEKEESERLAAEKVAKDEAKRLEKEEDDRLAAEAKMFN